ncbi:MAG: ribose ABC transporter permease [Anaerolineae bacterium]|nr:ribose ABC transporter permease [Anaerolineae bacterium]MBT7016339.1 ribose ABC transporter permease [Anaerolineae bacterium]
MSQTSIQTRSRFDWKNFAQQYGLMISFILLCLALSILSDRFLTVNNLTNILRQSTINGIISVGMTLIILTRGIDLSVGSILALSAVITADMLQKGMPVYLAIPFGLLVGAGLGLISGWLVTKMKVPPFIATLGVMTFGRGLALTYTQGKSITGLPEAFRFSGVGYLGSIPMPIVIALVVFLVAYIALTRTKFGEYIYAIGNNEIAAKLSGISVKKYVASTYVITGALSALAGQILIARLNSAQPVAGIGFEFDAIAAVVVGGTSFEGGEGTITGTLLGVLIIAVINNGLNLLDVPSFYQAVVKGIVIALALLVHKALK